MSGSLQLTVGDLKQYVYCPRIAFYRHVVPVEAKATPKMEAGRRAESSRGADSARGNGTST
ncbi:MAG: hypothetical protein HY897_13110 [Deltaproteobacteria bacterium]|nr:hypothetical protein [Deltaproteobacteria bacterium]